MEVASSNTESRLFDNGDYNKYVRRHKRRRKICMVVLCVYMLLTITGVILNLIVYRPRKPVITLDSLALDDLAVSVDAARLKVFLNITVSGEISIENPNRVSVQYDDINPYFEYRGEQFGEANVPAGKIGARTTSTLNFTATIMTDRLSSNPNLYMDVVEKGMLELTIYMKLKGKVKLPVLFKITVKVSSKCDMSLNISTAAIADQSCHSKIKV